MYKDHQNVKIVTVLLFKMPAHYLVMYGNMCHENDKLKIHPRGWQHLIKLNCWYQQNNNTVSNVFLL